MHTLWKEQVEKANGKGRHNNQQQRQKPALIREPARYQKAEAKGEGGSA
jgi:hypothetical protein